MTAKPYQGHHCWNCWNVALWIGNDEWLYNTALDCKRNARTLTGAAKQFMRYVDAKTPDGARYTITAVRAALGELQ